MSQRDDMQHSGKKKVRRRRPAGSEPESSRKTTARRRTSSQSAKGKSPRSVEYDYDRRRNTNGGYNRKRSERSGASMQEEKKNRVSRNVGLAIAAVQLIATIVFMAGVFVLNMLPTAYVAAIGILLLLFWGIILASQFFSKKNAITGKVVSILITVILIIGSYFLFKTSGTISNISGGDYELDNVVVAVMADDPAESIQDAADYTFGVQYSMNGDQITQTVEAINKELGSDIDTAEYDSLAEQAQALHDGKVDAIIYNEGYTGILEEAFEGYSQNTKIIYTHSIKREVEDQSVDVAVKDETFSVYISGIDVFGPIETNSRSDVNIIAVVNPTSHQILLVTTPRDYYVEIPGISGGQKDKLTHAGIYGVDASMATLEQLYDTDIDFYARVNFTSLIEIVDALGGVDVESEYAFTTGSDSGEVINVVQGTNHFNGEEALAFSRERYNVPGGDNQRGKDQQAVITAMIKKMVSPAILTGANGILNSVSGNVETNMTESQIQELIKTQLSESPSWNITSMAAEGTGDSQYCYSYSGSPLYVMQPDQASVDAIKDAIDAVENGETLEGTTTE